MHIISANARGSADEEPLSVRCVSTLAIAN